jgi:hypothetical protein
MRLWSAINLTLRLYDQFRLIAIMKNMEIDHDFHIFSYNRRKYQPMQVFGLVSTLPDR